MKKKIEKNNNDYTVYDSVIEYTDHVNKLFDERPDKRKKQLYKEWLLEINHFAKEANRLSKFPIYGVFK